MVNYYYKDKVYKKENWYHNYNYCFDNKVDSINLYSTRIIIQNKVDIWDHKEVYVPIVNFVI